MALNDARKELREVREEIQLVEQQLAELLERQQILLERRKHLEEKIKDGAGCEPAGDISQLQAQNWSKTDFPWCQKLDKLLKEVFRIQKFRQLQLQTMNVTMSNKDCILIMPTGGGKSLCYQLTALVSRGITLVVSPLISLMQDQLMALQQLGVNAAMLSASSTKEEVRRIQEAMVTVADPLKLLYVTPEKLAKSKRFMSKVQKMYEMGRFARLAVDEVHCCSQWGHDFRPDYKFLGVMRRQFPGVPILGLTATATESVLQDVKKILGIPECIIFRASFNRHSLYYEVKQKTSNQESTLDTIKQIISTRFKGQTGIVYCLTQKDSEEVAAGLCKRGVKSACYHSNLDPKWRSDIHKKWTEGILQVMVATIAFGMGIDKADVRFVIHHSISKSMENYYQESGRAGRDDEPAYCILFFHLSDMFRQSTMVMTEQTGLEKLYGMVAYAINHSSCRRTLLAQHFSERWESSLCKGMCDHCDEGRNSLSDIITKDVTSHYQNVVLLAQHASKQKERVTALKMVDSWLGKGKSNLRLASVKPPEIRREDCERIIAHMILEGYLKEDFHFTPYSTISYLVPGHKCSMLSSGRRVFLDFKVMSAVHKHSQSTQATTQSTHVKPRTSKLEKKHSMNPVFINHENSAFTSHVQGTPALKDITDMKCEDKFVMPSKRRKMVIESDSDSDLDFGNMLSKKPMATSALASEKGKTNGVAGVNCAIVVTDEEDSDMECLKF